MRPRVPESGQTEGSAVGQTARVLRLLRAACEKAGSQNRWAKAHGIKQQYVNQVLNGRQPAGPQILDALGLTRTVRITKKASADAE